MSIRFNMNTQKAIECVLWIIQRGESNMYNIWKILFSAEKNHINKHGRPITGDRYIAMEFGTVPGWLYDATKIKRGEIAFYREDNSLYAERVPQTEYLSESDMECLEYGFKEYANLDFKSVMNKNHEEPAWKKNYVQDSATVIPFEDIIEEKWLKEDLAYVAHRMVL